MIKHAHRYDPKARATPCTISATRSPGLVVSEIRIDSTRRDDVTSTVPLLMILAMGAELSSLLPSNFRKALGSALGGESLRACCYSCAALCRFMINSIKAAHPPWISLLADYPGSLRFKLD